MMVIKRSLGPDINYKELPMQKRIQIDQKIVAKKRAVIDKISKKILRKLKAGEGERVKQAKLAKREWTQWEINMKTFKEARGDTAVFTFGRFNPPTTGHEKLINALAKQASSGQPMYVYPSHSQNPKKDPLPHNKKVAYMRAMFPQYRRNIVVSKSRNVFDIAVELYKKGHKAIIMVVGSDRVQEFANLLDKYNGVEGRHGYYGFDNIEVVSAGERDPDAEGVTGMSASKMRAAAQADDYEQFKLGLPKGFKQGEKLFKDVRSFMGLKEEYNLTLEELNRDLYIRGEIWNVGDVVKTTDGDEGTIIRKGTNYVVFEDLRKVWLHNLEEVKQDKDIKDRDGTQPAKYYAKDVDGDEMSVATKKAYVQDILKKGKEGKKLRLEMQMQTPNHRNTPRNSNRCMVRMKTHVGILTNKLV